MVSVVICTYNRTSSLRRTLESLGEMSVPADLQWELIVVDNNSTDSTREVVEGLAGATARNVRYVFEGNQGLSNARNTGVKAAKGDVVAFTDDDVKVDKDWLVQIRNAFKHLDCMGMGGKIVPVWNCEKPSWLQEEGPYALHKAIVSFDLGEEARVIRQAPFGANMAFKREAFANYGLFRTDLGPNKVTGMLVGDDVEFFDRLIRGGERIVYAPGAVVYHPVAEARTQKRYFQSWYFSCGRYLALVETVPETAVYYFGAPRYLFRILLENIIKWMTILDTTRRFYYKLQVYETAGEIAEMRRLSAEKRGRESGQSGSRA